MRDFESLPVVGFLYAYLWDLSIKTKEKIMENKVGMFSKKMRRGAYGLRVFGIFLTLFFILGPLSNFDMDQIGPFGGIILLVTFVYMALLNIQRLNDLELSRWYILLGFIPLIGFFFVVAMLARKGKSISEITKKNTKTDQREEVAHNNTRTTQDFINRHLKE